MLNKEKLNANNVVADDSARLQKRNNLNCSNNNNNSNADTSGSNNKCSDEWRVI